MMIRNRIIVAFGAVMIVFIAIGASWYSTSLTVDREADDVEQRISRTDILADYIGQVRGTIGLTAEFGVSEKSSDLALLAASLLKLRKAAVKLDDPLFAGASGSIETLRRETASFLSDVDAITKVVLVRQKCSADISAAIIDLQVIAVAVAERAADKPNLSHNAVEVVGGIGSSATAALRYRFSRDPADMNAAQRWLDIAKARLTILANTPEQDRRFTRFINASGKMVVRYRADLEMLQASTEDFTRVAKVWNATAARLLSDGIAVRLANSLAQHEAVARTRSTIDRSNHIDMFAGALAAATAMLLAGWLVKCVATPLVSITEAMRRIAAGDLGATVAGWDRTDEVGRMAAAVEVFRDGLLRVRSLDGEKQDEQRRKLERAGRIEALNRAFEREVGAETSSLAEASAQMTNAAKDLLEIAAHTSSRSIAVATAAREASANVRLVASNTEEVSSSLREINEEVSISTVTASDTARRAQEADGCVRALINGAAKIGEVVGVIRSIAHDTNLLALNATIEAARAGTMGRGFGVVAGEVKNLAVASSKATDEVAYLINSIQQAMQSAAKTIQEIKASISAMDMNSCKIVGAVEEQSTSVARITSSAAGAAVGAEKVTTNIMDVMEASRSTDAAARQVLASANNVAERAGAIHRKIEVFLVQAVAS